MRLVDINGSEAKRLKLLAAIQNPDCGWFYRRGADTFKQIPGIPIAYWASDALLDAFGNAKQLSEYGKPRQGLATGENARFVREWWEVDDCKSVYSCGSIQESIESACKWFPYNKGGDFRKWYGNNSSVVNWENDGQEIRNYKDQNGRLLSRPQNTNCFFSPSITWSKISSGSIAFRFKPAGHIFDVAGTSVFSDEESLKYLQGACNSSVIMRVASMLSPTLNFEVGQIATYPIIQNEEQEPLVNDMVDSCRELSKTDWDSFETSWDFKRNLPNSDHVTFMPDSDNVLPITDDEYFDDDIVRHFIDFVRTVYGEGTLEQNLAFIAEALGGKGTSREVIRTYFLKDFFKDHCQTYKKRPIYWLFDSGKKNGFKCLVYMHRYQPDLLARIRTDYVHEQQERYRAQIGYANDALVSAERGERVRLDKRIKKLNDQLKETVAYEEKLHHLADQMIKIDLDDGVKVNYAKFQDVLAKIK